jgi:YfiH family protein
MTDVLDFEEESLVSTLRDHLLEPLRSHRLSNIPGIVHGVTYRVPGFGKADGNVGQGAPRDAEDAWNSRQAWAAAIGFDPATIVGLSQIHGSAVILATVCDAGKGATPGSSSAGAADALITKDTDVTLMTLHADCLPILVVDPKLPAVAAIHAGWRGTVENVAGSTIRAMVDQFGSDPSHLVAFLGPSIRPCCYQVGPEVASAWSERNGRGTSGALIAIDDGWILDLPTANMQLLMAAGLREANIEVSDICTKCNGDRWFSHRGQGPETGRFAAFIAIDRARL